MIVVFSAAASTGQLAKYVGGSVKGFSAKKMCVSVKENPERKRAKKNRKKLPNGDEEPDTGVGEPDTVGVAIGFTRCTFLGAGTKKSFNLLRLF